MRKSFAKTLFSDKEGVVDETRTEIFAGRERHSSSRWMNLGYPQRTIRTDQYLYVYNFHPERWPAGAPPSFSDVDHANKPPKIAPSIIVKKKDDPAIKPFFELGYGKRPQEELYDIKKDPGCMDNLAAKEDYKAVKEDLNARLFAYLKETEDPRVVGPNPDIFESYQRYSSKRGFSKPEWADEMDPNALKHLLATVKEDNEPIVPPKEIGAWGLKMGRWEVVIPKGRKKWELYDVEKDPNKTKDLSSQKPRVMNTLRTLYNRFK